VTLKVALLSWAQGLVKENFFRSHLLCHELNFIGFAGAYKKGCIGCFSLARDFGDGLEACRQRQLAELIQVSIKMRQAKIDAHQQSGGHINQSAVQKSALGG